MFNYLNELNQEIEKGEEQINELKQETEKYRGQDKGAASQRKRLIRDLQERAADGGAPNGWGIEALGDPGAVGMRYALLPDSTAAML